MRSSRFGFALALVALACKQSGTGPNTDLGYLVQIVNAPPGSAVAGSTIQIFFKIFHRETGGGTTPVSGKAVTLTVTAGGGTVGGSASTTISSGLDGSVAATWHLGTALGSQTLRGSVSAGEFADVSVTATQPPATQLVFATPPSTSTANGAALAQQPAIQLKDVNGGNAPEAGVAVSASIESGGGTLTGTTTVNTTTSGLAVFSDLVISGLIGNRTLKFTATLAGGTASVSSAAIALAAGAATDLAITVQPSTNASSGVALTQQPAVRLKDASTNNVSLAGVVVTASVATGAATLQGTVTATTDANGLATFSNLGLTGATGPVSLRFAATLGSQQRSVTSGGIALVAPPHLTIARAPTDAVRNGIPFFKQPRIQLSDGAGNPLTLDGVPVTVSVVGGAGTLFGTQTVNTNFGMASFTDLYLSGSGPYTLQFSAPAYASVLSDPLTVSPVTVSVLNNGDFFGPLAKETGHTLYFTFQVPAGSLDLHFNLRGAQGNPDLFLRQGGYPTFDGFNCVSQSPGTVENCDIPPGSFTPGETWYGVIYANSAYQNVTLNVIANNAACAKQTMTVGVTASGTLNSATDCKIPSLRDRYQLVVGSQQVIRFDLTTTNTISLRIWNSQTPPPGIYQFFTQSGSTLVSLMGPDTYNVDVIDETRGLGGQNYGVTPVVVSPDFTGCNAGLAFGGAIVTEQLATTDCTGVTPGTTADRIIVVIAGGQTLTVTMSSAAFDPYLRLWSGATTGIGPVLASDDNSGGGTTARLVYTNTGPDNNYTIDVSSLAPGATGAYMISVTLSPTYPLTTPPATTAGPVTRTGRP